MLTGTAVIRRSVDRVLNIILFLRNFIGNAAVICIAASAVITIIEILYYKIKARHIRENEARTGSAGSDKEE